jgi:uncharacterized membrane protein
VSLVDRVDEASLVARGGNIHPLATNCAGCGLNCTAAGSIGTRAGLAGLPARDNCATPSPKDAMSGRARPLLRIFVTGLLAALPLAATVAIFAWVIDLLMRWIGPQSAVGSLLTTIGLSVTGSELISYLMGVALLFGLVFALGLLIEANLQRGLAAAVNALVKRIPLVGAVYEMLQRMVALFKQRDADGLHSMRPVWCHFGGTGGAAALALLSGSEAVQIGALRYLAVLIPTAPVPIGGGLLWVPEEWVTPADVGIEAVTSIYVSMGVTAPQYMQAARRAVREHPGEHPPNTAT